MGEKLHFKNLSHGSSECGESFKGKTNLTGEIVGMSGCYYDKFHKEKKQYISNNSGTSFHFCAEEIICMLPDGTQSVINKRDNMNIQLTLLNNHVMSMGMNPAHYRQQ